MGDVDVGGASLRIVISEIPLLSYLESNLRPLSGVGTVLGGEFDWGGLLLKGNGGVQRYPQCGWQSHAERKGIRVLDFETHRSSRYESRS